MNEGSAGADTGAKDLMKIATHWVRQNAGGKHGAVGSGKLFPALDSGEEGLKGHLLEGATAKRFIGFVKALSSSFDGQ